MSNIVKREFGYIPVKLNYLSSMKTIGIIGAGVSGLTTAIRLQDNGYSVVIHTQDLPSQTTSAKAAAIWMPFNAEPVEQVNRWSHFSFSVFETLATVPDSGISMVPFLVLKPVEQSPAWSVAMATHQFRKARPDELPAGYSYGFMAEVPLIETPVYLPYLLNRFRQNGGQLIQEKITDIAPLLSHYDLVVNCSGLGAAQLFDDQELYSVQGQLVKVEKKTGIHCCVDDEGPNALAYVIPRKDCIILGSTADAGIYSTDPVAEKTEGILQRCIELAPELSTAKVIQAEVGLRPARSAIRCELDQPMKVIHNYGHGGSGYTVSWGCAEDVLIHVRYFFEKQNPRDRNV